VCSRAAILREGRLVEMAPIAQIIEQGEHRLKIWFRDGAPVHDVPLAQLPGVRIVEQEPGMLHVAYQGAADAILKWPPSSGGSRGHAADLAGGGLHSILPPAAERR